MKRRHLILSALMAAVALPWIGSLADAGAPKTKVRKQLRRTPMQFARMELGRRLFFDPQVSQSEARSCASCHAPDHGFSDPARISADDVGNTKRHSQTIIDTAFNPSAHWDGEFKSVEQLVVARLGVPVTGTGGGYGSGNPFTPRIPITRGPRAPTTPTAQAGKTTKPHDPLKPQRRTLLAKIEVPRNLTQQVAMRIMQNKRYSEAFRAAFNSEAVSLERIAQAIAAFCHSVESTESGFDRFRSGDEKALSDKARRGLALFEGKAGCNQCHISEGDIPLFTDYRFHNTAIAAHRINEQIEEDSFDGLRRAVLRKRVKNGVHLEKMMAEIMDEGRKGVTSVGGDERKFKTPTLRDVALRGPYMHNGAFKTLEEVVRYYAKGCGDDPGKDERLKPFSVTDKEVGELVAFLEALTGDERPGLAGKAWTKRARETKLRFVDAAGKPMKYLAVTLIPVGDPIPAKRASEERLERKTTSHGSIKYKPGNRTHMRVVLPEGVPALGGDLVPDTCREAQIQVPVRGRMTFVITFPDHIAPPDVLIGEHRERRPLAGHEFERTRFVRGKTVKVGGGRLARYQGWVRSDVGQTVRLRIPGRGKIRKSGVVLPDLSYGLQPGLEIRIDLTSSDR